MFQLFPFYALFLRKERFWHLNPYSYASVARVHCHKVNVWILNIHIKHVNESDSNSEIITKK